MNANSMLNTCKSYKLLFYNFLWQTGEENAECYLLVYFNNRYFKKVIFLKNISAKRWVCIRLGSW